MKKQQREEGGATGLFLLVLKIVVALMFAMLGSAFVLSAIFLSDSQRTSWCEQNGYETRYLDPTHCIVEQCRVFVSGEKVCSTEKISIPVLYTCTGRECE